MGSNDSTDHLLLKDDGNCTCCSKLVLKEEIILCYDCKDRFHAVCTSSKNKICTKTLLNNFMNLTTKDNFLWFCDKCLIKMQLEKVNDDHERINTLEEKILTVTSQLTEIKNLIQCSKTETENLIKSNVIHESPVVNVSPDPNPWNNSHKVVLMKNSLGEMPDLQKLTKNVLPGAGRNSVSRVTKEGNTVISCTSLEQANILQKDVSEAFPAHQVTLKKPFKSIIKVVGFRNEYNEADFSDKLFNDNVGLDNFKREDHYEFIKIKSCQRDSSTYQAYIKVSSGLRTFLKNKRDRVAIDFLSCRIYDQINVNRCNKCHEYGHWAKDCKNSANCAICAESHETNTCEHANDTEFNHFKCINCSRAGYENTRHRADSSKCKCFNDEHEKCKRLFLQNLNS